MSDKPIKHGAQLQSTQRRKHSGIDEAEWCYAYGAYQYAIPAQDQIRIQFPWGDISGILKTRGDSQSDYTATTPIQLGSERFRVVLDILKQHYKKELSNRAWEVRKSCVDEEMTRSVAIEEQVGGRGVETETDDVSQWTSGQLASSLMQPEAETDMPRLREMIMFAEDTGFTIEQSKRLAPWLLSFAERSRDSSDPQDEAPVWSAIRTGASMLRPQAADCLLPLLEPGHSIETSLVTVKMLGRIFEAQPPAKVDEHQYLANEVYQMATSSLNPHVITASKIAAKAQLAIYALAAMASGKIRGVVKEVQRLNVPWFTQQTLRELLELANIWANRPVPVADRPQKLLDRVIQTLK